MNPTTVIVGILLGSGVAISLGLAVVLLIYLLIGGGEPAMEREIPALWRNTLIFTIFTLIAASSFYSQIRERAWRHIGVGALVLALAALVSYYWP